MDYKDLSIEELLQECLKRPCPEAWEELIRRIHPVIAKVALRACREWSVTAPDVSEDRVQDVFAKIFADDCALLRRFESRHENAFFGYLKVVTANLVYDHFRRPHPPLVELNPEINPAKDANEGDALENEIFFNKIDNILRKRGNGPREEQERAIFWLYFRLGMTAKEIASLPSMKLTVKGVESCIFRLLVYIRKMLFGDRPGGDPGGIPPD